MEREGEVRKPRPPFDPTSVALPASFRWSVFSAHGKGGALCSLILSFGLLLK